MESRVDTLDSQRYAFFPIRFQNLLEYRDQQMNVFWSAKEVDFRGDRNAWDELDENTKQYIKFLLFLFAQLDGIVNENLVENFKKETSFCKECSMFYAIQEAIEWVHNETYSLLIKAFIRDPAEQEKGLNSIMHYPAIAAIADWCFEWMCKEKPLTERIIAFACVEGIIFSSAFAGIYWIKRKNTLHGLTKANEWIARDEAIHTEFAIALYHTLTTTLQREAPLSQKRITAIIKSAVSVTEAFTRNAMQLDLVALSADEMVEYVKCTADRLSAALGFEAIYSAKNPFEWMKVISLPNKTNFFESKVSEYTRQTTLDYEFDLSTPF